NTMFFARDSHSEGSYEKDKKSNIKLGQQGIYKATKVNGNWANIQALPINSTKYSVSNPSLSKDGKTLYFASNMPGGQGETDIWKISIDNNSYGKPQNWDQRSTRMEGKIFLVLLMTMCFISRRAEDKDLEGWIFLNWI
ncbi:MAG: hypothetical protein EOO46_08925, partial [Flavobacterium sp.]